MGEELGWDGARVAAEAEAFRAEARARGPRGGGMSAPARTLRAAGRTLALGGAPVLMGIVNATPDSFSDAGELPDVGARVARARELAAAGARILDVGGESAFGGRPPVPAEEEAARVVPVIAAVAAELDVAISVDTYKPAVAEAAIAAGAHIVNDVSGLRDERLAEVCAATGAGLVLMHTRVAPKGTLLDPDHYDDVVADVRDLLGRADGGRGGRRRAARSSCCSIPARTSPRRRRRRSPCCAGSTCCTRSGGRCCWRSRARTSSARSPGSAPRERGAATLAAVGWAAGAGAHVLRVHDVRAAADFLAVRAVLSGERVLGPAEGLTPDRYPEPL